MCGFAGALGTDRASVVGPMTEALAHRGPDGHGYFHDERIALGHRRLSIIDLAGGAQPLANEDETIQLVCNGEIYNSPQLRKELIAGGHRFRTATDVEVILHLYEEHGANCVRHLRGMFSFAIWDSRTGTLLLARDHLGQKPLYYYQDGDTFLFASEVKAILAASVVRRAIDLQGLWHYISLRFLPDQHSLFQGIRKLPAATVLVLQDDVSRLEKYWDMNFVDKLPGNEQDITDGLDTFLRETVEMHLLSDVRIGTFLSGGIDSGIISAMTAELTDEPVPCFSIGVKEQSFNELPYAQMVAQRYGMEAHERVVSADLLYHLPAMIHHLDEPADPFGVGLYLVANEASKVVKVVLTGDGGDENFAGYDRFAGQRLVDYYQVLPHWFRKQIMQRLIDRLPESFTYKSFAQKARWMNQMSFYSSGHRYAESMSFHRFTEEGKEQLFTKAARQNMAEDDSVSKLLVHFEADNAQDLVDRMLYTDLQTRMPDHLLVLADRMTMAHSLEARAPLVDYKLVEYAAAIPAKLKLKGVSLKYILRKVAARYLPREVVRRPKQGFGFPIGAWMRTDMRGFVEKLLQDSRFVQLGLFEQNYIQRLVDQHIAGQVDHSYRLWILINLELWHRLYLENETVESIREQIEYKWPSALQAA